MRRRRARRLAGERSRPRASPTRRRPGQIRRTSTRSGSWCATASTIPASTASTGRSSARASARRRRPRARARTRRSSINAMLAKLGASHTHYLHAGGSGLLPACRYFRRRARASRPRPGVPEGGRVLSGHWRVHRGRRSGPHLRNRGDRGRARACRPAFCVGDEILSADDRPFRPVGSFRGKVGVARLASDPPHVRRGADRDQRNAGRSSPERDVPARPQSQRPRHRRGQGAHRLRARLVLREPQDSVRARGPDRPTARSRTPTRWSGTCAADGAARSRNISTCSIRARRRCRSRTATARPASSTSNGASPSPC